MSFLKSKALSRNYDGHKGMFRQPDDRLLDLTINYNQIVGILPTGDPELDGKCTQLAITEEAAAYFSQRFYIGSEGMIVYEPVEAIATRLPELTSEVL